MHLIGNMHVIEITVKYYFLTTTFYFYCHLIYYRLLPLLQIRQVESLAVVLPHVVRAAQREEPAGRHVDLVLLLAREPRQRREEGFRPRAEYSGCGELQEEAGALWEGVYRRVNMGGCYMGVNDISVRFQITA